MVATKLNSRKTGQTVTGNYIITFTHGLQDNTGPLVPDDCVLVINSTSGNTVEPYIELRAKTATTVIWDWINAEAGATLNIDVAAWKWNSIQESTTTAGNLTTSGTVVGSGGAGPSPQPFGSTFVDGNTAVSFRVDNIADPTKTATLDLSGQATGTNSIVPVQQANGVFPLGSTGALHGSTIEVQASSAVAQQAGYRANGYSNDAFVGAQFFGFKSRGVTVGARAALVAGDVMATFGAGGVCSTATNLVTGGFLAFNVATGGVFATYLATELSVVLTNLAGVQKSWWLFTSEGDLKQTTAGQRILPKEGANAMMGVGAVGGGGTLVVANTLVSANSRIFMTRQDAAATIPPSVSARTPATSFTITADANSTIAWIIFEPAS